jgi:nucleoid DNA-binding protein
MPARKSQPSPKPPRLNMMLIVADIHDRTGIPKEYISATLRGFKELVRDSMAAGVDIDMGADFGKFVAIEVAGREHYVPATGNTTRTPVRRRIRFRPSLKLRNLPALGESAHLEGPATKAFGLSTHTSSTHPKEITSGDQAPADDPDAEVASVEAGIAEVIEDFREEPEPEPEPGAQPAPKPKGTKAREKQAEVVEEIMEPPPAPESDPRPKRGRPRKKAVEQPLLSRAASGGPGPEFRDNPTPPSEGDPAAIIDSIFKDPKPEAKPKNRRKRTSAVWSPDDIK